MRLPRRRSLRPPLSTSPSPAPPRAPSALSRGAKLPPPLDRAEGARGAWRLALTLLALARSPLSFLIPAFFHTQVSVEKEPTGECCAQYPHHAPLRRRVEI